jgi:hypothetical protein
MLRPWSFEPQNILPGPVQFSPGIYQTQILPCIDFWSVQWPSGPIDHSSKHYVRASMTIFSRFERHIRSLPVFEAYKHLLSDLDSFLAMITMHICAKWETQIWPAHGVAKARKTKTSKQCAVDFEGRKRRRTSCCCVKLRDTELRPHMVPVYTLW